MNVVQLSRFRPRSQPLICFVDLQVEYVSPGRALAVEETDPWMENCRALLEFARSQRLPIAHFRQLRRDGSLNAATSFAAWIDEFRPRTSEMVFERSLPSCYSADGFAEMADNIDDPTLVIVGLTSSGACLATAIDCFHRQHACCFVADSSWSRPIGGIDARQSHAFSGEIIRQYSSVLSTNETMEWLTAERFSQVS